MLLIGSDQDATSLGTAWKGHPVDLHRCHDLGVALVLVGQSSPDLVMIGESTGRLDPFDFLRALRQVDNTTAVSVGFTPDHADLRTDALAAGATTVVRRPFSIGETGALLQPGVRRDAATELRPIPIDLGRLKVEAASPRIWVDGVECLIPLMEFRLLRYLAARAGEIVPRVELETAAWGDRAAARSNSLSVHVARLRRRLQAGSHQEWICSVRGFGYRLIVPAPIHPSR